MSGNSRHKFNVAKVGAKTNAGSNTVSNTMGNMAMPKIRPSRFARALVPHDPPMLQTRKGGVVKWWVLDYKALERNKYAPWGRGHAAVPLL